VSNTSNDVLADLPSQRRAILHILRLGFRFEPALLWISLGTTIVGALPDALVALWLGLIAKGLRTPGQPNRTMLLIAGGGIAFSCVGGWVLRSGADRLHQRFRQRLGVALETHVARLQATTVGIEQHERPEVLDRLAMLRDQVFTLDHIFLSLFGALGIAMRLIVVIGVLASVHPALILLGIAALPPVVVASGVGRRVSAVWEGEAANRRLARHLFVLHTEAPSAKELRVAGATDAVAAARAKAWDDFQRPVRRMRLRSGFAQTAAWSVFATAFVVAVVLSVRGATDASGALIVVAAGARLTAYIGLAATEVNTWGFFVQGSQRLLWLEDLVERRRGNAEQVPPQRLSDGITLENVSFAYPGVDQPLVVEHVNVRLPAGCVVAVVGENGAGKSTLVKLLAKLYEPTEGRILVDDVDLATINATAWRERMAGAFQDFVRFELPAQGSIGLGDLPRVDDAEAVAGAVTRAGAVDVIERLPEGLSTQLGPSWPGGVDLSGGQWQKVALARGLVRDDPLLVVLDEPTSALDAETEHALFERFAEQARIASQAGRVTVLVSHRFSTVRMADLIIVLSGTRVVEVGSHDELIARGATYAELYAIQASAYH